MERIPKRLALAAISAAALIWGSAGVWSGRPYAAAERQGAVAPTKPFVAATGKVRARREATVRAKGAGRVLRYAKIEGEWAREGDAVVLFDDALEAAALREAEAELFGAGARFKRLEVLHRQKAISDQEYDDADGALRLARARRDKAGAALEERVARAPFAGRILKTYLEPGESAAAGAQTPLFVIGDTRGLKVRAEVDELDIGRVAEGNAVELCPDAFPDRVFRGVVERISGILGRKTMRSDSPSERMDAKVLEVEIGLEPVQGLKPGASVQVKIFPRDSPGRPGASPGDS